MRSFLEDLRSLLHKDGGVMVAVEFLGEDGVAIDGIEESPVADVQASESAIAYAWVKGAREHGHRLQSVHRDGDQWILHCDERSTRLVVSPLRSREDREAVRCWLAKGPRPWLDTLLLELHRGLERNVREVTPTCVLPSQTFKVSWRSEMSDTGGLRTAGALLLTPDKNLLFRSLSASLQERLQNEVWGAASRLGAQETFTSMTASGNGVTYDWSSPFDMMGPSAEVVAARLLTRLRYKGRLAAFLRELWLSIWIDNADDVMDEADHALDGTRPDPDAADYLARLVAEHDRLHPARSNRPCRRR